jgi:hypothetical protein
MDGVFAGRSPKLQNFPVHETLTTKLKAGLDARQGELVFESE